MSFLPRWGEGKTQSESGARLACISRRSDSNCGLKSTIRDRLFLEVPPLPTVAGFAIKLPSLKERKEDIPVLAENFLKLSSEKTNKRITGMSKEFIERLQQQEWKGNIRELRNVLERACILTETSELLPEHLPYEIQRQDKTITENLSLANVEKDHIQKVLAFTKGNKTKTAEYLGIGLTTLYRKIEEYHIDK